MIRLRHALIDAIRLRKETALLLQSATARDAEATRAWEQWCRNKNIDDVTWEEQKILARIAARIDRIAPDHAHIPIIRGLAKAHWTQSQLMLRDTAPAIDLLIDAGMPVMVFKGAALASMGSIGGGPRISADLDILVPRDRFAEAVSILWAAGWRSRRSREYSCQFFRFGSGLGLRLGRYGNLDIHHQPIHEPRLSERMLEGIWARAEPATIHGRHVLRPCAADMVVITAVHASRLLRGVQVDIARMFDIDAILRTHIIDPALLVDIAADFQAIASCIFVLDAMRAHFPSAIADRLVTALRAHRVSWRDTARLYEQTRLGHVLAKPLRIAASFLKPASTAFEPINRIVRRTRPMRWPTRSTAAEPQPPQLRHELVVPAQAGRIRWIALQLEVPQPSATRRFRFDVAANGAPVARLSARPLFKPKGAMHSFVFRIVPPPAASPGMTLAIEALSGRETADDTANDTGPARAPRAVPYHASIITIKYTRRP